MAARFLHKKLNYGYLFSFFLFWLLIVNLYSWLKIVFPFSHVLQKEKKLRDLMRTGNCLVKRFQKHKDNRSDLVLFFSQVDMKLVSRVLKMSRVTTDQLVWCHKKLSKITFINRKIHREPSFLLFPCWSFFWLEADNTYGHVFFTSNGSISCRNSSMYVYICNFLSTVAIARKHEASYCVVCKCAFIVATIHMLLMWEPGTPKCIALLRLDE